MNTARRPVVAGLMRKCSRRLSVLFFMIPVLHAAPTWQAELTSRELGPFLIPDSMVVDLQVSWNGMINAGTVRMEFAPPDIKKTNSYVIRSSAASHGAAALLFPYQTNFWSEMDSVTLRPRYFHAVETDKKETVVTTVNHDPPEVKSEESAKLLKTGTVKLTSRVFTYSPVFDIFSAMLHVRSQKLDPGDRITLAVLPFDTPYLLRVTVQGREVHNGRKAIRLTVGMRKIDRKTMELLPYKKLKQDATLWLTDDGDRIPMELRAAVFIGDVRATLIGMKKP